MDLWFDFSNKKQKCIVINKRGKYFCLSIYHLFIVCMLYECVQVWAVVHAYVCASMWRLEIDVWCLHFFEIFTVTILCVCVCVWDVYMLQMYTTVSAWITDTHYCVWITDTQCCVYLDYTHTLLSPAGSRIHTSVSGWIADTHYCVWLYSGLGIQAQFLVLVNQMFYPWNKPLSYS